MKRSPTKPAGAPRPDDDRLESWKVIAQYLERSVRTVRRWEDGEGLPIHRHRHDKGSTVFAFRSELDAWREERLATDSPTQARQAESEEPRRIRITTLAATAGVVLAVLAVTLILLHSGDAGEEVLAPGQEPVRVLVATTDNQTDNPVFDGALEAATRRAVSNTPALELVSTERVQEIARLMRRDPTESITRSVAQEVSLRDGAIDAILAGRVEKLGAEYLLGVDVLSPVHGTAVASHTQQLERPDALLGAVRQLARRAAQAVVAELPALDEAPPRLAEVTSSSLRALRLYSRAEELLARGYPEAAAELLGLAVNEDERFASAHAQLAWALAQSSAPMAEVLAAAATGNDWSRLVSDRERFYVQAAYHHLAEDWVRARASYAALLSLAPDHYWGHRKALELCVREGWSQECVDYQVRLAELRPDSFRENYSAAWALAVWRNDPERAQKFLQRARGTVTPEVIRDEPLPSIRSELFRTYQGWLQGELVTAMAEMERIGQGFDSWPVEVQDLLARELGQLHLTLGKIQGAERWFQRISDPSLRHEAMAAVLFAREDKEGLRLHLQDGSTFQSPMTAILMAMVGLTDEARKLVADLELRGAPRPAIQVAKGWIALNEGRPDEAQPLLEEGIQRLRSTGIGMFFAGSDRLAMKHWEEGKQRQAIRLLEMTGQQRSQAVFGGASMLWMKCEFNLASYYRRMGRDEDARQIEERLLALLEHADQGHPMVRRLQESLAQSI